MVDVSKGKVYAGILVRFIIRSNRGYEDVFQAPKIRVIDYSRSAEAKLVVDVKIIIVATTFVDVDVVAIHSH